MTRQRPTQRRVWQDHLDRHGRVEFHLARRRVWLVLVLAIMIGGLFSALASSGSSPSERLVWGAGAALGAVGVVFFSAQLVSKRVPVVVDADGVHVEWTWWRGLSVRWSAIEKVTVHRNRGTSMVALVVSRDFERGWLAARSAPLKALVAVQRTLYGTSLLALPFPLAADADDLAGWLQKQARQRSGLAAPIGGRRENPASGWLPIGRRLWHALPSARTPTRGLGPKARRPQR